MENKFGSSETAEEEKGVVVMKGLASRFSAEALVELKKHLGIELDDDHDYSQTELNDLYDRITDDFPYEFDAEGKPLRMGRIFEGMIDALSGLVELA